MLMEALHWETATITCITRTNQASQQEESGWNRQQHSDTEMQTQ